MRWLTANLLWFLIPGLFLVVASFVRIYLVTPHKVALSVGCLLLLAFVVGVFVVVSGPPSQGGTEEEKDPTEPAPAAPKLALDRLRLAWNSNATANWPAALTLAELSESAYLPPYLAEKKYNELGFPEVMPIVKGSMIGYVITGEDVTVVVFRGTDFNEVSDWIANLTRSTELTEHGDVHKGFYDAYESMKDQVDAILAERKAKHLWITGHSLGGALAVIGAYDIAGVQGKPLNGVITFGQPMVGRQDFARYIDTLLDGRYARFVNRDDIVPKVPPSHIACGSLVWFTEGGVRRNIRKRARFAATVKAPGNEAVVPEIDNDIIGEEAGVEVVPLTEEQFDELQRRLKVGNIETERLPEGTPKSFQEAPWETWVFDHGMENYRAAIRVLLKIEHDAD